MRGLKRLTLLASNLHSPSSRLATWRAQEVLTGPAVQVCACSANQVNAFLSLVGSRLRPRLGDEPMASNGRRRPTANFLIESGASSSRLTEMMLN